MFEHGALDELAEQHPHSAAALITAAGSSLERGWRAISIVE